MIKNKLMIWRTESGITHPSSSSPLGHWGIMSHLNKSSENVGGGDHDDVYNDHDDENWIAPDRSHREEFSRLVLLRGDVEEGASADDALVPGEDPFLLVFLLAVFFIFAIFTLEMVIALELLPHTNLLPGKPPISRRAHHLILILTASTSWRLVGLVAIFIDNFTTHQITATV